MIYPVRTFRNRKNAEKVSEKSDFFKEKAVIDMEALI
jgi:hypothetical protein